MIARPTRWLVPVLASACSSVVPMIRPAPTPACTTSRALPTIDTVASIAGLGVATFAGVTWLGSELAASLDPTQRPCRGCVVVAFVAAVPGVGFLLAAKAGRRRADACRDAREREARDVATTSEPLGPRTFYCTLAVRQPGVGACSRWDDGCRAHHADLMGRGIWMTRCRPQTRAWCLTMVRTIDATAFELCLPSPTMCATQRAVLLRRSAYAQVAACAPGATDR